MATIFSVDKIPGKSPWRGHFQLRKKSITSTLIKIKLHYEAL